ncbi:hypothetical protein Neosp_007952 [[Neocosmospora] mangrovei]
MLQANDIDFIGDILIGADGIHSTVRGEMRRLASMTRPGWFDEGEEEDLPCDYNCIFGISRPCQGIVPGGLHEVFRHGSSYLISGGQNGRVYWFRFEKLPQRLHGTQIPRYTQKDLEEVLDRASNDPILPGLTFSALIENRITAVLTPLPEYVYKKWHFGRIFTLGDSAHKMHPIGGHGGNAAIETAAALTNSLVDVLSKTSSPLTTTDIAALFGQVQALRYPRAMAIKAYSRKKQLTESLDSSLQRFVAFHLLPRVREQDVTRSYSAQIPASEKLNMLPVPYRKKLVPYKDELVAKPKRRGTVGFLILGIYLTISAVAFYLRWLSPSAIEVGNQINEVLVVGALGDNSLTLLQRARTAIPWIGDRVAFMATAFVPGLSNPTQQLGNLQFYSLSQSLHPIIILTLEGFRGHFAVSVLTCPWHQVATSAVAWQFIPILIPLLCLVFRIGSRSEAIKLSSMPGQPLPDVQYLRKIYLLFACFSAVIHWQTLLQMVMDAEQSQVFRRLHPSFWREVPGELEENLMGLFCVELWGYCLTSYVWCVSTVWDLQRVGLARINTTRATIAILLAYMAVGPGSAMALVWYFREDALAFSQ